MASAALLRGSADRQTATSLAYAGLIIGGWLVLHVLGVFVLRPEGLAWLVALPLVAALTWLNVGLFIVAHDCMHGSFAPGRPKLNLWVGRVALFVYAGFVYDQLVDKHHDHHRHAGTEHDPDFSHSHPRHFWPWYVQFFRTYFGWSQIAVLGAWFWGYTLLLGAPVANTLLFWAVPSILSSLQLFTFGTYLPHRHEEDEFRDRHNARSNDYPGWLSLLTCFHFGYHHEHHAKPGTPWWRLPGIRGTI